MDITLFASILVLQRGCSSKGKSEVCPIALISKADSQEDAPFSIASFMICCDSAVNSPKSSTQMFLHFSLVIFCFRVCGKLLVRGVVVKIELLGVDFGC